MYTNCKMIAEKGHRNAYLYLHNTCHDDSFS